MSPSFGYGFTRTFGAWQKGITDVSVAFGKRFKLAENVSYDPSISVTLSRQNGATHAEYSVTPLSFSLHF